MRLLSLARNCFTALMLSATLGVASGWAQALPAATPASLGVSAERLNRLSATLQQYVDEKRSAGVVTIVLRQGKVVHFEAFGKRDIEAGAAMQKDTIFRIASMSKAITSVATMILFEEGKLFFGGTGADPMRDLDCAQAVHNDH